MKTNDVIGNQLLEFIDRFISKKWSKNGSKLIDILKGISTTT